MITAHIKKNIYEVKDKDKWVDFMMKYELGLEKPDVNRAINSAATIGISYIIGGLVPLSAYFFSNYLFTD